MTDFADFVASIICAVGLVAIFSVLIFACGLAAYLMVTGVQLLLGFA